MIDVLLKLGSLDCICKELEEISEENPSRLLEGAENPSVRAVRQFLTRGAITLLNMTLGKCEENWLIGQLKHDRSCFEESPAYAAARCGQVGVLEWFFNRFPASLILQAPVRTYDASFPSRSAI